MCDGARPLVAFESRRICCGDDAATQPSGSFSVRLVSLPSPLLLPARTSTSAAHRIESIECCVCESRRRWVRRLQRRGERRRRLIAALESAVTAAAAASVHSVWCVERAARPPICLFKSTRRKTEESRGSRPCGQSGSSSGHEGARKKREREKTKNWAETTGSAFSTLELGPNSSTATVYLVQQQCSWDKHTHNTLPMTGMTIAVLLRQDRVTGEQEKADKSFGRKNRSKFVSLCLFANQRTGLKL